MKEIHKNTHLTAIVVFFYFQKRPTRCYTMETAVNGTNDTTNYTIRAMDKYSSMSMILYTYFLPLIVCIGMVGNLLSIYLILVDKAMRAVSSSMFLMSLLAADTGMLLSLFLVWLEVLGYPLNHLPVVCPINVYLSYVFGFLAIWWVFQFVKNTSWKNLNKQ